MFLSLLWNYATNLSYINNKTFKKKNRITEKFVFKIKTHLFKLLYTQLNHTLLYLLNKIWYVITLASRRFLKIYIFLLFVLVSLSSAKWLSWQVSKCFMAWFSFLSFWQKEAKFGWEKLDLSKVFIIQTYNNKGSKNITVIYAYYFLNII